MKANFKYIRNFEGGDKSAQMFIYDEIDEGKVNGVQFAYEMRYLAEVEKVPEIKVRINSPGGNVLQAFSIVSAIINTNEAGKTEVNTYNDGVAASSAGFILLCGANVYAKDYSRLMIHGVSGDATTENEKSALSNLAAMITTVFSNRTGIVASFFEDLLNNGRDNWFNTQDAIKQGFIKAENIENTGVKLNLPKDLNRVALAVANKANEILNELKPLTMKKVIAKLGLQEAASEEVVLAAVENALEATKTAENSLKIANEKATKLEGEKEALETKLNAVNKSAAVTVVENAIKEGKFTPVDEAAKTALIAQAENGLEAFKTLIKSIPTKAANILDEIKPENLSKNVIEKVNNRGLRQLEKEDAALLAEIRNSYKADFVKMYNEAYGTTKTEAEVYA